MTGTGNDDWRPLPCGAFVRRRGAYVEVSDGGFTGLPEEVMLKEVSDATGLSLGWRYPPRHHRWKAAPLLAPFLEPGDPGGSRAELAVEGCEGCAECAGSRWVPQAEGRPLWLCERCRRELASEGRAEAT